MNGKIDKDGFLFIERAVMTKHSGIVITLCHRGLMFDTLTDERQ